jgi:hypothetical protein
MSEALLLIFSIAGVFLRSARNRRTDKILLVRASLIGLPEWKSRFNRFSQNNIIYFSYICKKYFYANNTAQNK